MAPPRLQKKRASFSNDDDDDDNNVGSVLSPTNNADTSSSLTFSNGGGTNPTPHKRQRVSRNDHTQPPPFSPSNQHNTASSIILRSDSSEPPSNEQAVTIIASNPPSQHDLLHPNALLQHEEVSNRFQPQADANSLAASPSRTHFLLSRKEILDSERNLAPSRSSDKAKQKALIAKRPAARKLVTADANEADFDGYSTLAPRHEYTSERARYLNAWSAIRGTLDIKLPRQTPAELSRQVGCLTETSTTHMRTLLGRVKGAAYGERWIRRERDVLVTTDQSLLDQVQRYIVRSDNKSVRKCEQIVKRAYEGLGNNIIIPFFDKAEIPLNEQQTANVITNLIHLLEHYPGALVELTACDKLRIMRIAYIMTLQDQNGISEIPSKSTPRVHAPNGGSEALLISLDIHSKDVTIEMYDVPELKIKDLPEKHSFWKDHSPLPETAAWIAQNPDTRMRMFKYMEWLVSEYYLRSFSDIDEAKRWLRMIKFVNIETKKSQGYQLPTYGNSPLWKYEPQHYNGGHTSYYISPSKAVLDSFIPKDMQASFHLNTRIPKNRVFTANLNDISGEAWRETMSIELCLDRSYHAIDHLYERPLKKPLPCECSVEEAAIVRHNCHKCGELAICNAMKTSHRGFRWCPNCCEKNHKGSV